MKQQFLQADNPANSSNLEFTYDATDADNTTVDTQYDVTDEVFYSVQNNTQLGGGNFDFTGGLLGTDTLVVEFNFNTDLDSADGGLGFLEAIYDSNTGGTSATVNVNNLSSGYFIAYNSTNQEALLYEFNEGDNDQILQGDEIGLIGIFENTAQGALGLSNFDLMWENTI